MAGESCIGNSFSTCFTNTLFWATFFIRFAVGFIYTTSVTKELLNISHILLAVFAAQANGYPLPVADSFRKDGASRPLPH
jgi:hypothetical protein